MDTAKSQRYQRSWQSYREAIKAQFPDLEERQLEFQFESLEDWSLFHSLEEVKSWFLEQRSHPSMKVEEVPLAECQAWSVDRQTGNIGHQSGEFFVVHGLRVRTRDREAPGGWDQPILTQVGFDGGLLGLLRQRHAGVPHYLLEAKFEPGNYHLVQLSPTLQATFSNLKRAHHGRKPHFSEFFEEAEQHLVHYDQWLSEDGGRFFRKRNKGMLVEVEPETEVSLPPGFRWFSLYQIKRLLWENAWVNPHIRGIIAHL